MWLDLLINYNDFPVAGAVVTLFAFLGAAVFFTVLAAWISFMIIAMFGKEL